MNPILILICFAGLPNSQGEEECAIATLQPTTYSENTTAEVVNVYCGQARGALAANYPGAKLTRCEEWQGKPLGSSET